MFRRIFLALIAVVVFYFLAKFLRKYSFRFYQRVFKNSTQLATLIATLVYLFMLLSGIFIALEVLGLESVLAKLLAGAGVVGVIAGFAFKDICCMCSVCRLYLL